MTGGCNTVETVVSLTVERVVPSDDAESDDWEV